ncbi:hypothetical protein J8J42_09555 [Chryseobacterium sp. cx-311]|uniref:hypothetical protein n=1 Tax=Marnyiella aurantia TaxID=2758037 RepID=UPI001AE47A82|nr:hypothetical protein [Marnyiella aurantia]MBP0613293.1 hypothetical protein [Marnyiella aurantia]
MEKVKLEPGNYYHIFNRGNNGQDIFFENENYEFFLHRLDQYITPFCNIIAWVLLRNHFHLLVYIKETVAVDKLDYTATESPKQIEVHLQFGHFFNSYAKSINKRYHRTGSLFEKNFERVLVDNHKYFKNLIHYIHFNPVKHGFTEEVWNYPWSSYGSVISHSPTKLNRDFVLAIYNGAEEFKLYHKQAPDDESILELIIE